MSEIGDIMISRLPYDGKRFKTAKDIAMTIQSYLAEQRLDHFISKPKSIDIPTSANAFDETCMAFMRLDNDRDHQMFVEKFNARIGFRGKTMILRLCCEKPKGWSASYEKYELVWSSYPRDGEQQNDSQPNHEPFRARQTKAETSRAEYCTRNSESWSDHEDEATVKSREQATKVEYLTEELSKIKVQNKELEKKLIEAERGRERAEKEAREKIRELEDENSKRGEKLEEITIEAEQGLERAMSTAQDDERGEKLEEITIGVEQGLERAMSTAHDDERGSSHNNEYVMI